MLPGTTLYTTSGLPKDQREIGVFDFDIRLAPANSTCTVNGDQTDVFQATFVLGAGNYKYPTYDFSQNKHFTFK